MITFYGYNRCGTSKKGEKFLEAHLKHYNFIDVTINPPDKETLQKIIKLSKNPIKKFFNTSGVQYRELKIKDKIKTMSDDDMLKLLTSNGKLIKRPIVTDGKTSTVGFNESIFQENWGR